MITPSPPATNDVRLNEFLEFQTNFLRNAPTFNQVRVSANYNIIKSDCYIGVTSTSAARSLTLPPIISVFLNAMMIIKDESGGAAANNITINCFGADTIEGVTNKIINSNYGVLRLVRGPTQWFLW